MLIEIIIPAYNCSKTLDRTLSSLGAQTYADFLVHIIDDCSTEELQSIIDRHTNLNLRVTRNESNQGCGMTRQVGIDNTNADYIAFLDSDDVLMPYTVEVWYNAAKSSPKADIFHSHFYEQSVMDDEPVMILHDDGFTWCHGKLYKVDFIRKHGIRNRPDVKYADDSFFNSICTELGKMSIIPIPLYMWLNNSDSITRSENLLTKGSPLDFINAMLNAIEFIQSKGVTEIKHLPITIRNLEMTKHLYDDETLIAFEKLKSIAINNK